MSLHYYIRLEQGRDRHPSTGVLDALARALRLDEEGREHLARLAEPVRTNDAGEPLSERVHPGLVQLMHQWTGQACLLLGPYRDVLAANALATAINPNFTPGRNLMREVFLDPQARARYPDWGQVAQQGVAALRASVGAVVDDPVRDRLTRELAAGSPEFAQMWAGHEARAKPRGHQRFRTSAVGIIDLLYEPFLVPDARGHTLFVFFAMPGTHSAQLLHELSRCAVS